MPTKLENKIQLSKNSILGDQVLLEVTYEVNYFEDTKKAVLIADSIVLYCAQTKRIIIDDDVLKSDFLRMFCRQDAENVNWWEKMASLRFRQQRLLDNACHKIDTGSIKIPKSIQEYGDMRMSEDDKQLESINQHFEPEQYCGPY
jgi:hypothetical protein